MNRGIALLLATVAISFAAFWCSYQLSTRPTKALLAQQDCGMEWLQKEYRLSEAQFARIEKLHEAYRPACARRCGQVAAAHAKVRELTASSVAMTPEIEAALKEWTLLENDCRLAMLKHVYAVSAEMSPEEGCRYLKMATASIVGDGHDHAAMMAQAGVPAGSN
jgi:hypothetical protein